MNDQRPAEITPAERRLTAAEFQGLAEVPPEIEWFNNISNPGTRRIYKIAIRDFMQFTGIVRPEEFRASAAGSRPYAPKPAGGIIITVPVFLREERCTQQPGQRRQATQGRERRRLDADYW